MYEAQISFAIFTIFGVWRPINWSSFVAVWIYNIFTISVTIFMYSFDISLLIYLILYSFKDMDEFAESSFWFLAIFIVCVKITNLLLRRDEIINLKQMLQKDWFQPRNNAELCIQNDFDFTGRRNTICFLILALCSTLTVTLGSISQGIQGANISLPFKTSLPYDCDYNFLFWFTYTIQIIGLLLASCINVGTETFITVMMLQTCSQLRIISHRLETLPCLYDIENTFKNNDKSNNSNNESKSYDNESNNYDNNSNNYDNNSNNYDNNSNNYDNNGNNYDNKSNNYDNKSNNYDSKNNNYNNNIINNNNNSDNSNNNKNNNGNNNNNDNNNNGRLISNKTKESRILQECIMHHNYLYLLCRKLNDIFSFVLIVQFGGTIVDICTNIYKLSTVDLFNNQVLLQIILLPSILVQIFLYCWYGNELKLTSLEVAEAAYMMDWTVLTNKTKKGLLLIMARARKPIIITGGSIITMSLDTFVNILRTSYMAFNLLKNTAS